MTAPHVPTKAVTVPHLSVKAVSAPHLSCTRCHEGPCQLKPGADPLFLKVPLSQQRRKVAKVTEKLPGWQSQ